jgi:hypothetical protein
MYQILCLGHPIVVIKEFKDMGIKNYDGKKKTVNERPYTSCKSAYH